jgi:hypothetical protein
MYMHIQKICDENFYNLSLFYEYKSNNFAYICLFIVFHLNVHIHEIFIKNILNKLLRN